MGIDTTDSLPFLAFPLLFWFSLLFCGKPFFWDPLIKFSLYFYKFKISKIRLVFIINLKFCKIWMFSDTYYLCFNWMDNPVDASPLVGILSLSSDHTEWFQYVDDIIYSSSLDSEFLGALIEQEQIFLFFPVDAQEPTAQFAQRFFFAVVFWVVGVEKVAVGHSVESHGRHSTIIGWFIWWLLDFARKDGNLR